MVASSETTGRGQVPPPFVTSTWSLVAAERTVTTCVLRAVYQADSVATGHREGMLVLRGVTSEGYLGKWPDCLVWVLVGQVSLNLALQPLHLLNANTNPMYWPPNCGD